MPSTSTMPQPAIAQPRHRSNLSATTFDNSTPRAATPVLAKGKEKDSTLSSKSSLSKMKLSDVARDANDRLAILNSLQAPLSPTLPPSPPLSPRPLKRKSPAGDTAVASQHQPGVSSSVKRQRTSAEASPPSHIRQPSTSSASLPPPPLRTRSPIITAKKEEGEVDELPPQASSSRHATPRDAASRRPTRSRRAMLSEPESIETHKKFQATGTALKRSGDKKREPGSRTSARNLQALLEQTDSLLHFAYSFWALGLYHSPLAAWESLEGYLHHVRTLWEKVYQEAPDEDKRGKVMMFIGLIDLVRWCSSTFVQKHYTATLKRVTENNGQSPGNGSSASPPGNFQPTPPYHSNTLLGPPPPTAPSPASSSSSGKNHGAIVPPGSVSQSPSHNGSTGSVTMSADVLMIQGKLLQANYNVQTGSSWATLLALPMMRRHFPKTYEISVSDNASTGHPLIPGRKDDRLQVDVESAVRGEGEWAWPPATGEDVPHVVGFGRSLIWEFGLTLGGDGYRGAAMLKEQAAAQTPTSTSTAS